MTGKFPGRQVFPLCGAVEIHTHEDAISIQAGGEPTLSISPSRVTVRPSTEPAILDATNWPRFRRELIGALDEAAASLGWTTTHDGTEEIS
ncbi:hypothetical protein [Parafrankia sp. FMc2]|uniref:hypothetical protein n=1 Tax=Parafrankia sp. FMc2 TaxID=3233196 RepID=UPI0034D4A1D2